MAGARAGAALLALLVQAAASPLAALGPGRLSGLSLTPFVRHWEPAHYDLEGVRDRKERRHAPAQYPAPLRFYFTAHNREFKLNLQPDPSSVFAEGAEFHSTSGQLHFDPGQVYTGTLDDDEATHVYGIITADGLFDGTITTASEEYFIEPLHRYGISSPHLHSIIYRESDVLQPSRNTSQPCASHLLHLKKQRGHHNSIFQENQGQNHVRKKRWMPYDDEMQEDEPRKNPELPLDLDVPYSRNNDDKTSTRKPKTKIDKSNLITKVRDFDEHESNKPKHKTHVENHVIKTKAGVVTVSKDIVRKEPVKGFTVISSMSNLTEDGRHVNKRASVDPRKTTCMVYLQADHMFYQRYGSEEACIEVMTRHVQKVNAIYKVTDFNQDGKPDNITFMIKRIKVHTLDALKDPSYRFPSNYGVEKYLELFSEEDYDAFCLAYMFTYRDFELGTLGLAWTGDLKNAGGVCEKNGHYRGSMKSLNTGIVTLLNYGKHVPPAVSHVTLAHEIGHNFGSPHDPDVCTPGGEDGNYIMFARATSGDKTNNNKFSPCSLRSIDPVLNNKARSAKGCFTEPQPAICGNGVVEEGEECDCGWAAECTDSCCRPQAVRPHYKPCTLTENSVCSPSQGPCCTAKCTLKFGDKCRDDNGCRDSSYCDGKRPQCPSSRHKPNRTRCDKEFVCYMGECTGSICLAYGLESCQCAPRPEDGPRASCELCCRAPGGPCRSSFQWNSPPYDVPDMYAKPGTPCNDYNGYCDVFQKCREVDPSGPLATLRKLLLSDESIASFKRWLLDHWYAVLLILLAVIALLVGSSRWLGRRSDAKLQSVTIIHSSTTETVRLPDSSQPGLIVHTAIRSKLPLKKKVALRTRAYRNKKESKSKPTDKTSPTHGDTAAVAGAVSGNKKRKTKSTKPDEQRLKITKENTAVITTAEGKPPKHIVLSKHKGKGKKRKGKVKKETIDYSSIQKDSTLPTADNEALSKVQKWLLSSPQPTVIPKSKSTPVDLADRSHRPQKTQARKSRTSKSANNLLAGEKARLQVIFKPPFRFSVKICKSDKTKVVSDKSRPEEKRRSDNTEVIGSSSKTPKATKSSEVNNTSIAENNLTQASAETSYANVLPRSASDCKAINKLPDVKLKAHKKSNSVGQKKETTESKQNLLAKEEFGSAHLYENLMNHEAFVPKSCSMPRRQNPVAAIARQSSYNHLPRAQIRPQRNSTNNLSKFSNEDLNHFYNTIETLRRNTSANNDNTNTASSSGSSKKETLHKGSSLNNLQGVQKNSARNRYSMPSEHYNFGKTSRQNSLVDKNGQTHRLNKLQRQLSENEIPDSRTKIDLCLPIAANLKGFQLVVGKDKLKRQLSENGINSGGQINSSGNVNSGSRINSGGRVQLCMPMSAGAEPHGGFNWKRSSLDCEVSKLDSKNHKKDELENSQVPNKMLHRAKRHNATFGEVKNSLPDNKGNTDDILISPEDFIKILDT